MTHTHGQLKSDAWPFVSSFCRSFFSSFLLLCDPGNWSRQARRLLYLFFFPLVNHHKRNGRSIRRHRRLVRFTRFSIHVTGLLVVLLAITHFRFVISSCSSLCLPLFPDDDLHLDQLELSATQDASSSCFSSFYSLSHTHTLTHFVVCLTTDQSPINSAHAW